MQERALIGEPTTMIDRWSKASRLFSRAQKLVAQERYEDALQAFAQAHALRPRAVGIALHRALALSEVGQLSEAQAVLQHAIAQQPTNPVLPMFLGRIYFDHARYDLAQTWCERALALNPSNRYPRALQALIALAQGDIPRGYRGLHQPLSLPSAWLQHRFLRGGENCLPSLLQQLNAALQSRLLLVVETYLLRYEPQARPLSRQLIAASQASATPSRIGSMMVAGDRLCTRMIMAVTRLYAHVRCVGDATARTARLLHAAAEEAYYLGDLDAALAGYTRLLKRQPEAAEVHRQLFEIYYQQGAFRQALKHLRSACALDPLREPPDAWYALYLGELLYHAGHFSEAAAWLARAAALGLHDYRLYYYRGLCRLRDGAWREARIQFARAVQMLNPDLGRMRLEEMWRIYQGLSAQPCTS